MLLGLSPTSPPLSGLLSGLHWLAHSQTGLAALRCGSHALTKPSKLGPIRATDPPSHFFYLKFFFVTNNVYIEKPEIADHNILDEDDIKSIASFPDLEWTFSTTSLVTFTKVLSSKMGRGAPHAAWVVSQMPSQAVWASFWTFSWFLISVFRNYDG